MNEMGITAFDGENRHGRMRRAACHGPRSANAGFRPDIEGLRAVAVLAVVLVHADVPGIAGGYVGVDVFFVISGFLITRLLWRDVSTTGTVQMRKFYGARARRLLPASATVGVVTAVASFYLLPPLQARSVFGDGIASALYVSNLWFGIQGTDYLSPYKPVSPFQHYWSLGVEEQFYLLWPPLIIGAAWFIRRLHRRDSTVGVPSKRPYVAVLAVVAVVSFIISLVATYVLPYLAFFSLPTRAWQLAVGGLIALTVTYWRRLPPIMAVVVGWGGAAMIILACMLLSASTFYPGFAALLPVMGAAMIIGAGCVAPMRGCGRILSLAPMQAIGRLSYSWYLWHWPVLMFAPLLLGHSLGLFGRLSAALIAAVLAFLTLRFIENPFRFAGPIRRSAIVSLALGGAVTAVAVSVCVALLLLIPVPVGHGVPAPPLSITAASPGEGRGTGFGDAVEHAFQQVQAAVTTAATLKAVPANLEPPLSDAAGGMDEMYVDACMRKVFQSEPPECVAGDPASRTTMALVGDSHAAMWSPAFRQVAEQRRWRLETMTKADCPLMSTTSTNTLRRLASQDCQRWRDQVMARLSAEHPRLIVVSMWRGYGAGHNWVPGFTSFDRAWFESLNRLVGDLRRTGAQVLVLGPIPDPRTAVPICLSGHLDDASACSPPVSAAVNASGIAAEAAAVNAAGGQYIDLTDLFCAADSCPVIVGNALVYFDVNHMTAAYARALGPVMGALSDRELAGG